MSNIFTAPGFSSANPFLNTAPKATYTQPATPIAPQSSALNPFPDTSFVGQPQSTGRSPSSIKKSSTSPGVSKSADLPAAASSTSPTVNSPRGFSNVLDVFMAPFRGQSLLIGGKYVPVASEAASVITAGAVVGSAAYGAGLALGATAPAAATAGGLTASTGAVGVGGLKGALIAGGIGAIAGYALRGSAPQNQQTAPSQQTSPAQMPAQNIAPSQGTAQGSGDLTANPEISQTGSGTINVYTSTPRISSSTSYQLTSSYQISTQNTTSTQSTTAAQQGSPDLLIPALIVGGALLLGR